MTTTTVRTLFDEIERQSREYISEGTPRGVAPARAAEYHKSMADLWGRLAAAAGADPAVERWALFASQAAAEHYVSEAARWQRWADVAAERMRQRTEGADQ